ncbi:phage tail tape measure protein [Nocardiopsis lucentensis]|uniref:phage tail tape measure protein n=1 Tax=Nocardiopsis lucentensis TaxID=53441 RepID=UPI00036B2554|nr:phage tail tape measure protein [Nocardiopsis lucentensis]
MAALEELTVVLDADIKKFDQQMQRAERDVKRSFNGLERSASKAGRTGGTGFVSGFDRTAARGMQQAVQRSAVAPLERAGRQFQAAGRTSATGFVSGFESAAGTGMARAARNTGAPMRDLEGRFESSGRRGGQGFTRGVGTGLAGASAAFGPVGAAIGATAGLLGTQMLGAAKDFEAAMNGVRAVTGATGSDFADLEAQAKDLGSTTQFSATEAGQAMEFLGMAGFSTTQIMESLPATLDLAAAGSIDLARAADIASNVLTGFGLAAEDMGQVSDVMAEAAASSNTNILQLGNAFEQVGPIANSAGLSFEETTAALGLLANAGLQGEKGGTALRGALASLTAASDPAQAELDRLGITATKADGTMRPLVDIVRDFENAQLDMGTAVKIFGREAAPGFLAILDQGSDALVEMTGNLGDAEGAAKEMADIRMEGLQGALKSAQSAVEGFFIAFADMGALDAATRVVDLFAGGVRAVTGFLAEHEDQIRPVLKVLGIFAGIVAGLVGALVVVKGAIAAVGAALAIATGPVGLVVAGIAALATGLVVAYKKSDTFRRIVGTAFDKVKAAADGARRFFMRHVWPILVEGWERAQDVARRVGRWFENTVFPALIAAWRDFEDAAGPIVEKIVGWFRDLRENGDEFRARWGFIWDQARERLDIFADLVRRVAGNLIDQFKGWVDIITGLMSGDWGKVWDGAVKVAKSGWDNLVAAGTAGVRLLGQAIKLQFVQLPRAIAGWLADVIPVLAEKLPQWTAQFVRWAARMQGKLNDKLADWLDEFGSWLANDVPDLIRSKIGQWTDEFTDWAQDLWPEIRRTMPEVIDGLTGWIADQPSEISENLQSWSEAFGDWAGDLHTRVGEGTDQAGLSFTEWMEQFAEDLPGKLDSWTLRMTEWIEQFAEDLPTKLDSWVTKFTEWVEGFAEKLPEKLERLTEKFIDWASGAPEETVTQLDQSFQEAGGEERLAEEIETNWGPRLLAAFGSVMWTIIKAIPGLIHTLGQAMARALISIMTDLGMQFAARWVIIIKDAGRWLNDLKVKVVEKLGEMRDEALAKVDQFKDDTIGRFEGLYDTLVGNSIVPDMVRDIISETGKLPAGVDGEFGKMNTQAIGKAESLQAELAAKMVLIKKSFSDMAAGTQQLFSKMVSSLGSRAKTLAQMLSTTFAKLGSSVVEGFERTVAGVKSAWGKLRQVIAAPVRYVISPVVNKGLRGVWNTVAGKVPGLSKMPAVRGFQAGGIVDLTRGGKLPGYSAQDNRIAAVRDGEGVLTPSATDSLGGRTFINAANRLGARAGQLLLEGFASGGIVGAVDRFRSQGRSDFDNKGGVVAAGNKVMSSILSAVGGRYGRRDDFPGTGYHTTKAFTGRIMDQIRKHKDDLEIGQGAKAVVKLANQSVGRYPEVPNGSNRNAISKWYGMPGAPWCAMFISWLFNRTKNSGALRGASRTAWTGDYYTSGMKRVPESQRRPADVQVFGTDHVRLATEKGDMGVGGNEGNNVSKSVRRGGALFRPAFAKGGMVDPRDFVMQDKGWEPSPPPAIAALRDIFRTATFDDGGYLMPGYTLAYNGTGSPEPVSAEPIVIQLDLRGDDDEMIRRLRKQIQVRGGGNVQVVLGQGSSR